MPDLKVLFIASVYPRFEADLEVPWLRVLVSRLKKRRLQNRSYSSFLQRA